MSIETVRARLHEAAVSKRIPQYVEPTTGGRVWTAPALKAAAEACGTAISVSGLGSLNCF